MRLVRVVDGDASSYGVLEGELVHLLDGPVFGGGTQTGEARPLVESRLLAPVEPRNLLGMGANSGDDIPSTPVVFLKPAGTVVGPEQPIRIPSGIGRVDFEGELAAVVGAVTRHVPEDRVGSHLLGYTCANDVTARDLQSSDRLWTRAKGFDTFTPLGPWVETDLDPHDLAQRGWVSGRLVQEAGTSMLARHVETCVSFISSFMTLYPGDVVLLGAPGELGAIEAGDSVEIEIEGIGRLRNPVVADAAVGRGGGVTA